MEKCVWHEVPSIRLAMVSTKQLIRIDEVNSHYNTPRRVALVLRWLFWSIAALSLLQMSTSRLLQQVQAIINISFVLLTLVFFFLSQAQRYYWLARAESERRRALLTNALGVPLSHEETQLYYNNPFAPSLSRLAANALENTLFSSEVTKLMLGRCRLQSGIYLLIWIIFFATKNSDYQLLIAVTQIVFSAEILASWINLEILHRRFEICFEKLKALFRLNANLTSPGAIAEILDAVISYESAKSAAGVLLDESTFLEINKPLAERWHRMRIDLGID
jgi:hypothetical protein